MTPLGDQPLVMCEDVLQDEPKTLSGRSLAQNAHIPVNNGGSPTERPFRKYLAMGSVSEQ